MGPPDPRPAQWKELVAGEYPPPRCELISVPHFANNPHPLKAVQIQRLKLASQNKLMLLIKIEDSQAHGQISDEGAHNQGLMALTKDGL